MKLFQLLSKYFIVVFLAAKSRAKGANSTMSNLSPETTAEFAVVQSCDAIQQRFLEAGIHSADWYNLPRADQFERLDNIIGNTPLVSIELTSASDAGDNHPNIYSKQERLNPSGSHYDRAFLATIRNFEEADFIKPGDQLRDITSGSGGISLAALAWALGYSARITVPSELPRTRLLPMEYFGAEIVDAGYGYVQQAASLQTAEIRALKRDPDWKTSRPDDEQQRAFLFERRDETTERRICYLNHSENSMSPEAFKAIGHELVAQLATPPQAVLLAIGNWTTIAGITQVLREAWKDTRLIGYHGPDTTTHRNFGTKVDGLNLRFEDESLLDQILVVTDQERDALHAEFNQPLPLLQQVGHSTLMGMAAAKRLSASGTGRGSIVTIAYDQKVRY